MSKIATNLWSQSDSNLKLRRNHTYVRAKNNHIFFGSTTLWEIQSIELDSPAHIHIFITKDTDIVDSLCYWISETRYIDRSKVILHIPKAVSDLKIPLEKMISFWFDVHEPELRKRIKILCEKDGPKFSLSDHSDYKLEVNYLDKCVVASVNVTGAHYMSLNTEQTIENPVQDDNRELFKDKIISKFKATTPVSILRQFKNEDDIWDYINHQGDWGDEPKPKKASIKIKVPAGVDVESAVTNAINEAFGVNNVTIKTEEVKGNGNS